MTDRLVEKPRLRGVVADLLADRWSPEQIAQRWSTPRSSTPRGPRVSTLPTVSVRKRSVTISRRIAYFDNWARLNILTEDELWSWGNAAVALGASRPRTGPQMADLSLIAAP